MSDLRTSVVVDLAGNLPSQAPRFAQQFNRLGQAGRQQATLLHRSLSGINRSLDRLGNRYTTLITGGAAAAFGKKVSDLDERLTQLGIDAQLNGHALNEWKNRAKTAIQQAAIDAGVGSDKIISAYEAIVQKTGDRKFADNIRKEIAITIGATGTAGDAIGELFAEFQKAGFTVDQVRQAIAAMVGSGQQGSFILREMASLGPRITAVYGPRNIQGIKDMSAALQVLRDASGSSEQATTSFEALFRVFSDASRLKTFSSAGIRIFDDNNDYIPLTDILKNIAIKLGDIQDKGGNAKIALSKLIPDQEARRGLNAFIKTYLETRKFDRLNQLLATPTHFKSLIQDNSDNLKTLNRQMVQLVEIGNKFADTKLAGPIQDLAAWAEKLDPTEVEAFFNKAITGAKILTGVIIGSKILTGIATLVGSVRPLRGRGGIAGGLAGAAGGVTPVYVVNMPGAGLGGAGDIAGRGKGDIFKKPTKGQQYRARARSALRRLRFSPAGGLARNGAALAGRAGLVGAAGAAGYGVGTVIYKTTLDGTRAGDAIGRNIARVLAFFGNDESRAGLEANKKLRESFLQSELNRTQNALEKSQQAERNPLSGEIRIVVDGPARVTAITNTNSQIDFQTEHRLGPALRSAG